MLLNIPWCTGWPHPYRNKELSSPKGDAVVKNPPAKGRDTGDASSIAGLGRSPGEGKGYPLQYSELENSMDCIVHGVTKSRTRLSDLHFHKVVQWKRSEVAQSCPTLCNPVDCSLRGSSIHGIFQACILEWVSISFSRNNNCPIFWKG